MTENYQPPKHDEIIIEKAGYIVVGNHMNGPTILSASEAITLGLALMETGLHLKQKLKDSADHKD